MKTEFIKLIDGGKTPQRSTKWSAGYDVFSAKNIDLKANSITSVPLPHTVKYNSDTEKVLIYLRSSFGIKKHLRFYDNNKKEIVPYLDLTSNEEKTIDFYLQHNTDLLLEKGTHFIQYIIQDKEDVFSPFLLEHVNNHYLQSHTPTRLDIVEKENKNTLVLQESIVIGKKDSILIASGLKALIEKHTFLRGLVPDNEKRFGLANGCAVIDFDYYGNPQNDGEMFFKIENRTDKILELPPGTPIIELQSLPYKIVSNEIQTNKERIGGIGSTSEEKK